MTKYCPNCGKPYEEGVAFCAGCGTSLNGAKPAKASFKSAITKKGLSEVAGKSVKVFTIIVLVLYNKRTIDIPRSVDISTLMESPE